LIASPTTIESALLFLCGKPNLTLNSRVADTHEVPGLVISAWRRRTGGPDTRLNYLARYGLIGKMANWSALGYHASI